MSIPGNNGKTSSQLSKNNSLCSAEPDSEELYYPISYSSSSEKLLPLAAKDSEWTGFKFYPTTIDESTGKNNFEALIALFPDLEFNENIKFCTSTTDVTKILVGKTPNFSFIRKMKKLKSTKEGKDTISSETDLSQIGGVATDADTTSGHHYEEDEKEEPKRNMHVKRRKKRSDVKLLPAVASSTSFVQQKPSTKNSCKLKSTSTLQNNKSSISNLSINSALADDEDDVGNKNKQ